MKFGKHAPKLSYKTKKFASYLAETLPTPPAQFSILDTVYRNLGISDPSVLFPLDSNDEYGDCTCAALAHAETVFNGLVGVNKIMASADVLALYMKLTGGEDSGMAELDVLNYWKANQVEGDEIINYVSIDPKNHAHVMLAMVMFGGCYIGFQVQENAISDFDAKKIWTPGNLTEDGHAVYAVSYNPEGVTVLTWGSTQGGTWDWWDQTVDEAYAVLAPEAQKTGFAAGFNFAQLQADMGQM